MKIVEYNDVIFAKIIKAQEKESANQFYTDFDESLQFGILNYSKNYKTGAHYHNHLEKAKNRTDEILIFQKGSARVDFYNNEGAYIKSCEVFQGDIIILCKGGHNILFYEESKIFIIKNGGYNKDNDKTRIIGAHNLELKIEN